MLRPEDIDALAESLVKGYEERLVARLSHSFARLVVKDGVLTMVDQERLAVLPSLSRDATTKALNQYSGKISKEVRQTVLDALIESDAADAAALTMAFPGAQIAGASQSFMRIAEETARGVAEIIARQNIQMAAAAEMKWYDITAQAVTEYNQGASQRVVMERAVRRLADEGMDLVDYKSGVKSPIDVAVRRHIVTQTNQAATSMTTKRLEQMGHTLVMTSSHFGARPDHAVWQGKAFSRGGAKVVDGVYYPDFESSTGYGTGAGLAGWNCRHSFAPYVPGYSKLRQTPEEQNGMTSEEYYEATQQQRANESSIRKTKRRIALGEDSGLEMTGDKLLLGNQQAKQKAYCDRLSLPRRYERERAYGVDGQPRSLRVDTRPKTLKLPDRSSSIMEGKTMSLPGGGAGKIVPGSMLESIEVFAGKGTSTPLRVAARLVENYGGSSERWQHTKGRGLVDSGTERRRAMIHWFEEDGVGIVETRVKGWSKKQ